MAIDEGLLERVREILDGRLRISEKRMFGGMAFLCGGNLFLGVRTDRLMVRVGPERYAEALKLPHVRPMVHSGRGMTGYVFVDGEALDEDDSLRRFVEWGADVAAALPAKAVKPAKASKSKPPKSKASKSKPPKSKPPKSKPPKSK
jgi:TfoX/Sxy family transcriptional regulator of competence genes